jgi:acetyltransferase-like isoleucine patch superfamily enzyme
MNVKQYFKNKIYDFFWKIIYGNKYNVTRFNFGKHFTLDITAKTFSLIIRNVSFRDFCAIRLRENGKMIIGKNVFFNSFCSLTCHKSIIIGDNTIFGENVKIYDHNHKYNINNVLIKDQGFSTAPITIGNNCWIGSNVTILKGVNIGDNSVIGCGLIVYKDVPMNSVLINKQDIMIKTI